MRNATQKIVRVIAKAGGRDMAAHVDLRKVLVTELRDPRIARAEQHEICELQKWMHQLARCPET